MAWDVDVWVCPNCGYPDELCKCDLILDANGRPIKIGDWVTLADRAGRIERRVIDLFDDDWTFVALDDEMVFLAHEIVTHSGLEWVTCEECASPWPVDVRMNDVEECPFCDTPCRRPILRKETHGLP